MTNQPLAISNKELMELNEKNRTKSDKELIAFNEANRTRSDKKLLELSLSHLTVAPKQVDATPKTQEQLLKELNLVKLESVPSHTIRPKTQEELLKELNLVKLVSTKEMV